MTKARDLASGGFGLVLIKPSSVVNGTDNGKGTVNFSAVANVALDGVFSANYDNYRVIFNYVPSAQANALFYFRSGSSDITTSSYYYKGSSLSSVNNTVTWTDYANGRGASSAIIDFSNVNTSSVVLDISNAFSSSLYKIITVKNGDSYADAKSHNIGFQSTASTTGLKFAMASGTFTGTVSVYGYNK